MEKCRTGDLNLPKNLNGNARDLVKLLLVDDPMARLEISEIKKHKFFRDTKWTQISKRQVNPPFIPSQDPNSPLFASKKSRLPKTPFTQSEEEEDKYDQE